MVGIYDKLQHGGELKVQKATKDMILMLVLLCELSKNGQDELHFISKT